MRNACVADGRLLCMLVTGGLPDMTSDQSPEKSEATSHMLCGGMLIPTEGKPSTKS